MAQWLLLEEKLPPQAADEVSCRLSPDMNIAFMSDSFFAPLWRGAFARLCQVARSVAAGPDFLFLHGINNCTAKT
jgi:hypothetical protein